jgi:hypothetical protein
MQLLAPEEAAGVAAHVDECPACQAELRTLTGFLGLPEEAVEEGPSPLAALKEVVLQWTAPLVRPSGLALAGVRGAVPRAQTFAAAHLWLAVTVEEAENGRKKLLALITREDGYPLEHGTAWLSQANRLFTGGRVDARGNLVISDLEPGVYDLGIQCDGTRVWVQGVSV